MLKFPEKCNSVILDFHKSATKVIPSAARDLLFANAGLADERKGGASAPPEVQPSLRGFSP